MAFWGIEVKPGKPFTLEFDGVPRRLHISQATLAIGSSKQTSLVQCNVGNKSPVLLCALLPDKTESLQLNLEFEEDEEVLFSVIGPRGVHLTGFYTSFGHKFNDDDSESYGEDIANSENEGSVPRSDEDEYEDSFIDDDENPELLPPAPVSTDGVDELVDIDKRRNKTSPNKRLKKKYQAVESDDESGSWQKNTGNCIRSVLESESEDDFLLSSMLENKRTAKDIVLESKDCDDASKPKVDSPVKNVEPERSGASNEGKTLEDASNHTDAGDKTEQCEAKANNIDVGQDPIVTNKIDDDLGTNKGSDLLPSPELDLKSGVKPKKKRKERVKKESFSEAKTDDHIRSLEVKTLEASNDGKTLEDDAANHTDAGDKAEQCEAKANNIDVGQDPIVTNKIHDDPGTNKESDLLPSPELDLKNVVKPKKKRKERSKEERIPETKTDNHIRSLEGKTPESSNEGKTLEADAANHTDAGDKAKLCEEKTNNIDVGQDPIVTNKIDDDPGTNKGSGLLHSPELDLKKSVKPKKKRKERSKLERITEATIDNLIRSLGENESLQADTGAEHDQRPSSNTETGLPADTKLPTVEEGSENKSKKKKRKKEQEQKPSDDINLDVSERKADENISEKGTKKKKHKSKVQKDDENMEVPVLLKGEKEKSINELQEKNVITGSSQARILSNGLVIEDLESSKSDGKAAAPGRKLKVLYTAKLEENGQIIDSNGKSPYRFRLGDQDVMEGWNVGLDGMRAGDKRRLVVPPSLRNGSRGTAENVPPDSSVIYDVELLSVH